MECLGVCDTSIQKTFQLSQIVRSCLRINFVFYSMVKLACVLYFFNFA